MLSFFILFLIFVSAPFWNRFGGFWHRFWEAFGINFRTFLDNKRDQQFDDFLCCFFCFLFDFWLQVGTRLLHDSGGLGLLRPPRPSWRHYFDSVFLLASFWFGLILGGFGNDFSHFSINFSIIFSNFWIRCWKGLDMISYPFRPILESFCSIGWGSFPLLLNVWLHCFLYLVRLAPRPRTNIVWPGGLREAIKPD